MLYPDPTVIALEGFPDMIAADAEDNQIVCSVLAFTTAVDRVGVDKIPLLLAQVERVGGIFAGVTADGFQQVLRFAQQHGLDVGNAHAALMAKAHDADLATTDPQLYGRVDNLKIRSLPKAP